VRVGGILHETLLEKECLLNCLSSAFNPSLLPLLFFAVPLFHFINLTQKTLKASVYYNKSSIKRMLKAIYKRPDMKDKTEVFEKQAVPL
jgi:hypothetical protein